MACRLLASLPRRHCSSPSKQQGVVSKQALSLADNLPSTARLADNLLSTANLADYLASTARLAAPN